MVKLFGLTATLMTVNGKTIKYTATVLLNMQIMIIIMDTGQMIKNTATVH
jgi:hypothetical protein